MTEEHTRGRATIWEPGLYFVARGNHSGKDIYMLNNWSEAQYAIRIRYKPEYLAVRAAFRQFRQHYGTPTDTPFSKLLYKDEQKP